MDLFVTMINPVFLVTAYIRNTATGTIAEWALVVIGTTAVLFAIHDAFRNKTALPVIVTLSSILCVIPEVFVGDIGETCFFLR